MAGGKNYDYVMSLLNSDKMKKDLKKFRSSHFNKEVVPAVERMKKARTVIKEVKQNIDTASKNNAVEALNKDKIIPTKKSNKIKIALNNDRKILTNYKKNRLDNKKKPTEIDGDKRVIVDFFIGRAGKWITYLNGLRDAIAVMRDAKLDSIFDISEEVTNTQDIFYQGVTAIEEVTENIGETISAAEQQLKEPGGSGLPFAQADIDNAKKTLTKCNTVQKNVSDQAKNLPANLNPDPESLADTKKNLQQTAETTNKIATQLNAVQGSITDLIKKNALFKKQQAALTGDVLELGKTTENLQKQQQNLATTAVKTEKKEGLVQRMIAQLNQQGKGI